MKSAVCALPSMSLKSMSLKFGPASHLGIVEVPFLPKDLPSLSTPERIWHMQDSQDPILAAAFR